MVKRIERQKCNVFEIWSEHERYHDEKVGNLGVGLKAYFNNNKRWGVISITAYWSNNRSIHNDEYRLALIVVPSEDYTDTIIRAQEIWAEKSDEYIEIASNMKLERKTK